MKTSLLPALAIGLALSIPVSTTAVAETHATPENAENHAKNVLTINKLKQDLESAGFSDIKILQDSFVIQAKDKDGNPTIMSLSPGGVVAISTLSEQGSSAKASSHMKRTARAAPPEKGQTSGPASGTDVKPSQAPSSAGDPGTHGHPGSEAGPAVTTPQR